MSCSIERSPKVPEINAMLAAGLGLQTIERRLRADGVAIKRETIKRHLERCLPPAVVEVGHDETMPFVEPADVRRRRAESPDPRDFASLVHQRAYRALEADELRVSTRDGLAAQALLDRREERAKDRDFMIGLARLLSGGGQSAPRHLLPGDEEGEDAQGEIAAP